MKKVLIVAIAMIACFVINSSCSKNNSVTQVVTATNYGELLSQLRGIEKTVQSSEGKSTEEIEQFDYSNSANPHEWVGIEHNKCLDYLKANIPDILSPNDLTLSIRQPLSDEVKTLLCSGQMEKTKYLSIKYWNENVSDAHIRPYLPPAALNINIEKQMSDQNIGYLQQNKFVDPRLSGLDAFNRDFYQKLLYFVSINRISQFEADADSIIMYKVMETASIQESVDIIKQAEAVINNSTLDNNTKTRQLIFLSILRNSIGYWAAVIQNPNDPWFSVHGNFFNRVGPHEGYAKWNWNKFWEAVVTGVADAVGGIAGEAAGTAIGGPIGGAIGAGLVGSAASGVVAGLWP